MSSNDGSKLVIFKTDVFDSIDESPPDYSDVVKESASSSSVLATPDDDNAMIEEQHMSKSLRSKLKPFSRSDIPRIEIIEPPVEVTAPAPVESLTAQVSRGLENSATEGAPAPEVRVTKPDKRPNAQKQNKQDKQHRQKKTTGSKVQIKSQPPAPPATTTSNDPSPPPQSNELIEVDDGSDYAMCAGALTISVDYDRSHSTNLIVSSGVKPIIGLSVRTTLEILDKMFMTCVPYFCF